MNEIIKAEFKEIYTAKENETKLNQVELEIKTLTTQANQMALTYVIAIGQKLLDAKAMVEHGQWGQWLQDRVNYSQSTAENYIKIYEEYGNEQISLLHNMQNSEIIKNLTYTKALALIAIPAEDREEFIKENNVENISVRELKELIKQKEKEVEELEVQLQSIQLEKEKEIKQLQSDKKSLEMKIKESEKQAEEKIKSETDKLKAEFEKLNQEAANNLNSDEIVILKAEKAEAEKRIEDLKNALSSSGNLQIINLYFESFQETFSKLQNLLVELKDEAPDTYNKMKTGIVKILNSYIEIL